MSLVKKLAAAGLVVGAVVAGGIAVGLWTTGGSGSGQARATTAQTVTVTAATGAADLYPGFAGGDVYFTITNPNPYPVRLTSATAGAVTSSNAGACPAANVTVADATGLTLDVAAGATSATLSIADKVTMLAGAPDGCQGVSFTVALTLTGTQT